MHRSPDTKLFHQENDNGSPPDRNLPANRDQNANHVVGSYPHLVPSFRGRSRRLLHQHVHYSAGPIILLWDELDESIMSADDADIYDDDILDLEPEQ